MSEENDWNSGLLRAVYRFGLAMAVLGILVAVAGMALGVLWHDFGSKVAIVGGFWGIVGALVFVVAIHLDGMLD